MIKCLNCGTFFEVNYIGADVIRKQSYCRIGCRQEARQARQRKYHEENPRVKEKPGKRPGDDYVRSLVILNLDAGRNLMEIADGLFREEIRKPDGHYYTVRNLKGLIDGRR